MEKIYYSWDLSLEESSEALTEGLKEGLKNEPTQAQGQKADFSLLTLDFFDPEKQLEKQWQDRTGLNLETLSAAVETIIFMSEKPISLLKIKNSIDSEIPVRSIHESIIKLQQQYEKKEHGIRLQEVAEGYQFRTKATYSRFVQTFFNAKTLSLSPNALETLSIIAYRQPVSKTQVDKIRGVDSSHLVRGLMDKRLVKVQGRSDELGRPSTYVTTQEFLEVFNLATLEDLPSEAELNDLATSKGVGEISDIKTIVGGDKEKFYFDEMEELEELAARIKEVEVETTFTKVLKEEKNKENKAVENKTAFELLEEYVARDQTTQQNKLSMESDILTTVDEVSVVSLGALEELFSDVTNEEYLEKEQISDAIGEVMSHQASELLQDELESPEDEAWLEKKLEELDSKTENVVLDFQRDREPETQA